MTLDSLFNMAKGTQDAGETVNDVYKVGEISRKTGLQKQQDGSWAPPKGAEYQQAMKIHEGVTKTEAARQQAEKIHQGVLKTLSESKEDNAVVRAAKTESASEMAALRKKHDPVTGEGKSYRASKGGKTIAIKASSPEEAKEVLAKFGTRVSLKDIQEVGSSNDAACDEKLYTPESVNGPREKLERQLTGDCKIRIRKETTEDAKRYNPGDISEKTGLQKQNDGTWAKPKTATNAGGSDNQSSVNNVKVGQKVKFTFRGQPYSGTVEQVGKNAIKFTSSNGKPMMFRKDSIELLNVSSSAKEKPYRAPGPVYIPGDDSLLHNGL